MNINQYWLAVGSKRNWLFTFENGNLWGLKDFRETRALWSFLDEGDKVLIYVSKPVSGIVGCATVTSKFMQTAPLWPEEVRTGAVIWPLRFAFQVDHCLSPDRWESDSYKETNLQLVTRMIFQCIPLNVVEAVRAHLGMSAETEPLNPASAQVLPNPSSEHGHQDIKTQLCEIGRMQGFLAEEEYPIERNRLDVVWRRVERSVPTYAFEVQVGGDMYHALAKLKHARQLWNSHIFLAASEAERTRFQDLVSGVFGELKGRVRFLESGAINELFQRKAGYAQLEKQLGLVV